eukprot:TRINITY_DN18581_c0_g1_i1.p1 TRINITY_DN18581_c0_g1~~TRINITY_DN18581_c0_g1_i1.p1  ORF type:complete len:511 (+),score=155.49 TRINITY_DN18581_c0_g1_i1:45-1577(+)
MLIAVEGCCHGDLDKIYDSLAAAERQFGVGVDLLIVCGDFQSTRNEDDLECLACPPKYRQMGDFRKYFDGEKKAPVLTIFIGGNHEASNYLWENYYGGYVAENIYFLGFAGVVQVGGLTIAGMSGIYKSGDYNKGYFERPPYDANTMRSIYHQRAFEVQKLKAWQEAFGRTTDVCLTHDWPRGVYHYGDTRRLLRIKKDFADEVAANTLGSPAAEEVMNALRPKYHFSAHLHVKFSAMIPWVLTTDGSTLEGTRFLALDKCLPNRGFLQVLDVKPACGDDQPPGAPLTISHDVDWLAVVKATAPFFPLHHQNNPQLSALPDDIVQRVHDAKFELLQKFAQDRSRFPSTTQLEATPFDPRWRELPARVPFTETDHPQTQALCEVLGIENVIRRSGARGLVAHAAAQSSVAHHLRNTSVVETKTQLVVLASDVADANRLLAELMADEEPAHCCAGAPKAAAVSRPGALAAAPKAAAMQRPGAKQQVPPPSGDDDDDGEMFKVFVDTTQSHSG